MKKQHIILVKLTPDQIEIASLSLDHYQDSRVGLKKLKEIKRLRKWLEYINKKEESLEQLMRSKGLVMLSVFG